MIRYLILLSLFCSIAAQDVLVSTRRDCSPSTNEEDTCETCISKGSECFWCGGKENKCMTYEWYFPHCDLDDVKHKSCLVNLSAVVIVLSIIGGILLVIFIACACYCCCKCRQHRRLQAKKKGEKWQNKRDQQRSELEKQQALRTEQRNREMEAYRMKYGIKSNDSTLSSTA